MKRLILNLCVLTGILCGTVNEATEKAKVKIPENCVSSKIPTKEEMHSNLD